VVIAFKDNEIILPQDNFNIPLISGAKFFNLDPTFYAVIISPEGEPQQIKGGYLQLRRGNYKLFYIDKRNRTKTLEKITETTLDGATISLTLTITYRVADPAKALELQEPLATLFFLIQTDVREYIKTHTHDEIMGGGESQEADSGPIIQFIHRKQITHSQIARVFFIIGVAIERQGDPKLINIRLQQKQSQAENKLERGKKELEQKALEQNAEIRKFVTERDVDINKIKAQSDAEIEKIRADAEASKQETLRRMRILQNKHEIDMEAIKALIPALTIPGRTLTQSETQAVQALINTLKDDENFSSTPSEMPPRDNTPKPEDVQTTSTEAPQINTLANTLLELLRSPKKKD
jgi:hypothetical protein